jgi:hypothetical protein
MMPLTKFDSFTDYNNIQKAPQNGRQMKYPDLDMQSDDFSL